MDFPNNPPRGKNSADMRATLAEMLQDLVINDPDAPEELKLPVQTIAAARKFSNNLHDEVVSVTMPITPRCSEEDLQKCRDLLEYIQLMTAGFDNFLAQYNNK